MTVAAATPCGEGCRKTLRDHVASVDGTDVTVSTAPPLIPSPFPPVAFTCPHGTVWYACPTSEQIARWAEEGVE